MCIRDLGEDGIHDVFRFAGEALDHVFAQRSDAALRDFYDHALDQILNIFGFRHGCWRIRAKPGASGCKEDSDADYMAFLPSVNRIAVASVDALEPAPRLFDDYLAFHVVMARA